jgi:hypothetical protein
VNYGGGRWSSSRMSSKRGWEELSGGINYRGGRRVHGAFYGLRVAVDEQSEEWSDMPATMDL